MAANGSVHTRWKKPTRNGTLTINNNYIYNEEVKAEEHISRTWIYYLICGSVATICYFNSLDGDFVHDDVMAIKTNRDVLSETPVNQLFRNDFWGKSMSDNTSHKSYRPITVLTFRLNVQLFGLTPYSFHVVNVLLHTITTLVFQYICDHIIFSQSSSSPLPSSSSSSSPPVSFLAGLLFAVHPIHTEAVSGIVGRADILCCLLILLSFLFYHRCRLDIRWQSTSSCNPLLLGASFLLSAVAMLAKEHGITVLGICAVYDIFMCQSVILRFFYSKELDQNSMLPLVKRLVLICGMVICLLCFRVWMLNNELPAFSDQDNPASFAASWLTRVLTYSYLLVFNTLLLIYPSTLSYDWQMGSIALIDTLWDVRNLATLVFLVTLLLLTGSMLRLKQEFYRKALFLGLCFLTVPFLPASNLFFRVGFVVAERILYVPSMGYCILVALGVETISYKFRRKQIVTIFLSLCILLASRTVVRNQVWLSREALFRSGVEILPHNAKSHYNYANFLKDSQYREKAIYHYRQAISLYSHHASAHNNLGTLLNDTFEAEHLFRTAIQINPYHTGAHFNLGNALYKRGEKSEALSMWQRAIDINPYYTDPYSSIGSTMIEIGNTEGAEKFLKKVVEDFPEEADGYNNYGTFLQKINKSMEALEMYNKAYTLNAQHTVAMVNAARLHRSLQQNQDAENLYLRALCVQREPGTLDLLALLYFNTGRHLESIELFEEIESKFPYDQDAMTHYAQVLARISEHSKSEAILLHVVAMNQNHIEAYRQLANLYGILKRHKEAINHIDHAIQLKISREPNDAATLGLMYFEQGNHYKDLNDYERAFQSYKLAVQYDSNIPQAQLNLGAIYHMNNDVESAEIHYNMVRKLDPENKVLKDNMRKLEKKKRQLKNRR